MKIQKNMSVIDESFLNLSKDITSNIEKVFKVVNEDIDPTTKLSEIYTSTYKLEANYLFGIQKIFSMLISSSFYSFDYSSAMTIGGKAVPSDIFHWDGNTIRPGALLTFLAMREDRRKFFKNDGKPHSHALKFINLIENQINKVNKLIEGKTNKTFAVSAMLNYLINFSSQLLEKNPVLINLQNNFQLKIINNMVNNYRSFQGTIPISYRYAFLFGQYLFLKLAELIEIEFSSLTDIDINKIEKSIINISSTLNSLIDTFSALNSNIVRADFDLVKLEKLIVGPASEYAILPTKSYHCKDIVNIRSYGDTRIPENSLLNTEGSNIIIDSDRIMGTCRFFDRNRSQTDDANTPIFTKEDTNKEFFEQIKALMMEEIPNIKDVILCPYGDNTIGIILNEPVYPSRVTLSNFDERLAGSVLMFSDEIKEKIKNKGFYKFDSDENKVYLTFPKSFVLTFRRSTRNNERKIIIDRVKAFVDEDITVRPNLLHPHISDSGFVCLGSLDDGEFSFSQLMNILGVINYGSPYFSNFTLEGYDDKYLVTIINNILIEYLKGDIGEETELGLIVKPSNFDSFKPKGYDERKAKK